MRIVVDLNRCQGYAQCVALAPDVLKPLGEEALAYHPTPTIRSANEYCARWRRPRCRRSWSGHDDPPACSAI